MVVIELGVLVEVSTIMTEKSMEMGHDDANILWTLTLHDTDRVFHIEHVTDSFLVRAEQDASTRSRMLEVELFLSCQLVPIPRLRCHKNHLRCISLSGHTISHNLQKCRLI